MTRERWKDHPIYECKVSDQGRVYGIRKMLKPGNTGKGYYGVSVKSREGGKQISINVHRLVLEAFTSLRPEGHEADHKNRIRGDNRLVNLRWLSIIENRKRTVRGRSPNAKLKEGEAWLIKRLLNYADLTYIEIRKMFPIVHVSTIGDIANGFAYRRIK